MTRKMKDSGIEWIGEIPEDWDVVKLKHLVLDRQAGVWGKDENQDNLTNNKICIRIADFDYPRMTIRKDREFTLRNYTDNEISKCSLQKGDILIEKSGGGEKTPVGRTIIWNEDFQAVYANFIERLRVDKKQILPMFAQFCFFAFYGIGGSNLYFNQTTGIQNLNITGMMNDLRLPTPDLSTQIKIVDILDRKRNQIESIKSATIKEIETLENYKKSVITEAVTKGLDKNVEMKDSGIEWIGEIPKHWDDGKTLFFLKMPITDGPHTTPNLYDEGIPFVSAEAVASGNGKIDFNKIRGYISEEFYLECCKKYIPKKDDIYMIKSGATTGLSAMVDTDKKFTIWSPLAVFRADNLKIRPRLLFYILQSKYYLTQVELYWNYGTQQNIGMRTLEKLRMFVPPLKEQNQIADYLNKKTKLIDDSIAIKQKQLETLEEYKKSLIYEYVTGKKEVKDGEEI